MAMRSERALNAKRRELKSETIGLGSKT